MNAVARILTITIVIALAAASWLVSTPDTGMEEPSQAVDAAGASHLPLPPGTTDAGASLLTRSPFAPDRSAFVRDEGQVVETPPDVKLVAVSDVGGSLQATLLIGGEETTVAVGDSSVLGEVVAIEPDAVVLGRAAPVRISFY